MIEDREEATVDVRVDASGLRRDVGEISTILQDGLGAGADRAARGIETALRRAARSGRLEFEDLARAAGRALGEMAAAALKIDGGGGNAAETMTGGLAGLLGLPGRATGGPVSPGQAYVVGERGPELFVPTASGRVETASAGGQVNITVHVNGAPAASRGFMTETGRQVAREVRRVLERTGG